MANREKITYEIDPHNRLIAKKTGKTSGVTGFRKVLDGRFQTDKNNSLVYHIKKSADSDTPQQVKLAGRYSLDKNHNLVLTLSKWNNQVEGNRLIIKSELLDTKDNELSFSVGTRDSFGNGAIYILRLGGVWQADKHNRLSFNVTRERGAGDNLILKGAWKIGNNNEIVYTYTKFSLKTKEKITNALTFKGYWDMTEKHRILYVLNKEINSVFDLEVNLVKATKKGLEYKIGIGAIPRTKALTLSGEWKLNEQLGLLFEMPYEGGESRNITFGATCKFRGKETLNFKLKSSQGKNLDANLRLSIKILKDQGEAFTQVLKEEKELFLIAGIGFKW